SLDPWIPAGFRLSSAPVVSDYRIESSNGNGDVNISGEASGYLVAAFSTDSLRTAVRGLSVGAARDAIASAAPGSKVDIRLSPGYAPTLPWNPARISVSMVTEPTG